MNVLQKRRWSPYAVGTAIGLLSWFAFLSANHPLGITTPFEHTAALLGRLLTPAAAIQDHPYYQDQDPRIGWEWMLVVGVFLGGWISARLSGDRTKMKVPPLWRWRFGPSVGLRFTLAFLAAALMMFGARLANGCTSGHGISGTLQLAVSSWIFVVVIFATAIITSFIVYKPEARHHV